MSGLSRLTGGVAAAFSGRRTSRDDDDDLDAEALELPVIASDSLTDFGIDAETQIPDDLITVGKAKSVRFRNATPGYLYGDVDHFHSEVMGTLQKLGKIIHARDLNVHTLATALDKMKTDNTNLKYQIEALRSHGDKKALVDASGELVVENEREAELAEQVDRLQGQLLDALNRVTEFEDKQTAGGDLDPEEREAYVALAKWAEETEEAFADLEARVAELEADLATEQAHVTSLEEELEEERARNAAAVVTVPAGDNPELLSEISGYQGEIASLEERVATLESLLGEKSSEVQALSEERDELTAHVASLDEYIDALESGTEEEDDDATQEDEEQDQTPVFVAPKPAPAPARVPAAAVPVAAVPVAVVAVPVAEPVAEPVAREEVRHVPEVDEDVLDVFGIDDFDDMEITDDSSDDFGSFDEAYDAPYASGNTHQNEDDDNEDDEDAFNPQGSASEPDAYYGASEVPEGTKRPPRTGESIERGYAAYDPSAPLSSIPEGADPQDYL